MKRLIAISCALFSLTAFAANGKNLCESLPGKWTGNGVVKVTVDATKKVYCVYQGSSSVVATLKPDFTFNSDVTLTLASAKGEYPKLK